MTTRQRPRQRDALLLVLGLALVSILVLLGNWQMRRLEWKRDLIAAVEARAFGVPVDAPPPEAFSPEDDAYLRVAVSGTYRHQNSALVKAVTELGPGYWVMTPLDTDTGTVWINRGFVPPERRDPKLWSLPSSDVRVIGLLRPDEPAGTLLERNRPDIDRWVSRDLRALSEKAGLKDAAPYFIDAEQSAPLGDWPRGGLTLLRFRNSHLSYALTWYVMALLLAGALVYLFVGERHLDRKRSDT